jgi:hypothetical protein
LDILFSLNLMHCPFETGIQIQYLDKYVIEGFFYVVKRIFYVMMVTFYVIIVGFYVMITIFYRSVFFSGKVKAKEQF